MKPDDIYRLPLVGDPKLSPDGRLVAFVVGQADREANAMRAQIWLAPVDGSAEPRQLTFGAKSSAAPRWSPDGSRIAFVSNRDGDQMQVYVLPMEGGEPIKLTDVKESAGAPVWSPDGARIAFVSTVRGPAYDEEDEGKRPPRRITRLGFKADGSGWRSDRFSHVFVVPSDGSGAARQVTDLDRNHADPAWSPDGRFLALCANREDDFDTASDVDLHVLDVETGEVRRLTSRDAMCSKPSWSPDGTRIALRVYPDVVTSPRNSQVAVVDVASGGVRVLTAGLDRQCGPYFHQREPIWRDGQLLFPVEDAGNCHVYVVDADGGEPKAIITGELVVTDHDAVDDVIVHAVSTPSRPPELFCGDMQLTHFTDEFVASVKPSDARRFSAGDVGAWVMEPKRRKAGEKHPTLVFIHGGPYTQYGNIFFDEFQVATEAGYAVVFSNPRGSSGYAEEWGRAIRGPVDGGPGWGTVDFEDIMAVTEEAVRQFDFVDGDRLGVLGGSYGGFMTAWIVGHTDRFKAACAERGIYNVLSAVGTSDGLFSSASYWGGNPWENAGAMLEISPLTYADEIRTPLLIVHSDADHRCPVEQAEQLFTRLRMLGRDVEFLRFPQGSHDLSRSGPPAQRVHRFEAIDDWFARWL